MSKVSCGRQNIHWRVLHAKRMPTSDRDEARARQGRIFVDTLRQSRAASACRRFDLAYVRRLMPPCPFIGLNKPPMIQTREMRLPFGFRCRQDLDSHCRRDPIVVTILLSEATSSPLAALADALDVLLEGDDSSFGHVTQPPSVYTEGEDGENDQDEEDEGLGRGDEGGACRQAAGFDAEWLPRRQSRLQTAAVAFVVKSTLGPAALMMPPAPQKSPTRRMSLICFRPCRRVSPSIAFRMQTTSRSRFREDGFEEPPPLPEGAASSR